MNKLLFSLFFLVLTSCASNRYFRTQITDIPCELNELAMCDKANLEINKQDDYTLGFVEITDNGQFHDARQVSSLINLLQNESAPQYVTIYVHGWHHNANENDRDTKAFKESLKETKLRNPNFKVVGIYVGWQGETISLPFFRWLTFWDRKSVSYDIGRDALLRFLLQTEAIVKVKNENKLLTIGHSLGGSVVFNSLQSVFLERLTHSPKEKAVGFGDLVVLVNPAFEAIRFANFREISQKYSEKNDSNKSPLLIIASSESDTMIKEDFPMATAFGAMFNLNRFLPSPNSFSAWDLDTVAVGHFAPYITHRLEANNSLSTNYSCPSNDKESKDFLNAPSNKMQLRHVQNSAMVNPYWVMQIDKNIMPSHGFMRQKDFWCFLDLTLKGQTPYHTMKEQPIQNIISN